MKTEIRSNWSHAILICGKCGKKAKKRGLTFGKNGTTLRKALKSALGTKKKGRKASLGLVEVPCLDICPKNGVLLVDSRTPGQWRIITPDADIDELARQLETVEDQARG